MEALSQQGMKLVLLGDAVQALSYRLSQTRRYEAERGNRKLTVYLVGTFPIVSRPAEILDRLIGFSPSGDKCLMRSFSDKHQLRQVQWAMWPGEHKTFLMSFGAPMKLPARQTRGVWHSVPDAPDQTIDLRVYVPTFGDRSREEVKMTSRDIWRMSRLGSVRVLRPGNALEAEGRHPDPRSSSVLAQKAAALCRLSSIATGQSSLPVGLLTGRAKGSSTGVAVQLSFLLALPVCSTRHAAIVIA